MQIKLFILLIPILLSSSLCGAISITSVSPDIAAPGMKVWITGGPFENDTRLVLGNELVQPDLVTSNQIIFTTPQLPAGEYALSLQDPEESSAPAFILKISSPPPRIISLTPTNADECSISTGQEIHIEGEFLQPQSSLMLNGAQISAKVEDDRHMNFVLPPLRAGVYGLQVINADGKSSLPFSLYLTNIPKISGVSEGDDYINYYQLIIKGANFYHLSTLVVNEYMLGFDDLPPRQRIINSRGGRASHTGTRFQDQGDYIQYVSCDTMIYYRYPYSRQLKRLVLQVVNPDGKTTAPFEVSVP